MQTTDKDGLLRLVTPEKSIDYVVESSVYRDESRIAEKLYSFLVTFAKEFDGNQFTWTSEEITKRLLKSAEFFDAVNVEHSYSLLSTIGLASVLMTQQGVRPTADDATYVAGRALEHYAQHAPKPAELPNNQVVIPPIMLEVNSGIMMITGTQRGWQYIRNTYSSQRRHILQNADLPVDERTDVPQWMIEKKEMVGFGIEFALAELMRVGFGFTLHPRIGLYKQDAAY